MNELQQQQSEMIGQYSQRDLNRLERMHTEVMDYLVANKRTYQEEYELIQQKQSNLSKRGRDYVTMLNLYEQSKEKEQSTTNPLETNEKVS